jgi:hypothetical protein
MKQLCQCDKLAWASEVRKLLKTNAFKPSGLGTAKKQKGQKSKT